MKGIEAADTAEEMRRLSTMPRGRSRRWIQQAGEKSVERCMQEMIGNDA